MKSPSKKLVLGAATGAALVAGVVSPAEAAHGDLYYEEFTGTFQTMNDSGVTGTVEVDIFNDNMASVTINLAGLAPDLPHAQHIHGTIEVANSCPTPAADTDGDGFVSTAEGVPSYGGIQASLTTEGDTSPDSALAVERMPVTADGTLEYTRAFEVSDDIADFLGNLHVVTHGVDINGNGDYDFENGKSSLTDDLPLEATIPSACAQLDFTRVNLPPAYRDIKADDSEGFILRSYTALLDRAPDAEGFAFWTDARAKGTFTKESMLAFFVTSDEFKAKYGDMMMTATDGEWVDFLYQAVLGRVPDENGRAYWVDRLGTDLDRAEIILFFSDSPEYRALVHTS